MTEDLDTSLGTRSLWAGKAIPLGHLEEEITFLWKMAADNMRIGQNLSVRTSVLNLVICAPTALAARQASASLRDLLSTHLARVIIVILDRSASSETPVSSWVTLRSFPVISDLTRHNFEQVTIRLTEPALKSAASIIQPVLKPDLPVYLWWIGDPPAEGITFNRLASLSQRVIVDSASFLNPEHDLLALLAVLKKTPESAISDLNWGRLTPWRLLVAQFFDSAEYRPYLDGISNIEIEHAVASLGSPTYTEQGAVSAEPARALFLAGWLKERLGWKRLSEEPHGKSEQETGSYHWCLTDSTGRQTCIDIRARLVPAMHPGTICLLRLTGEVEGQQARFIIDRKDDPEHVLTSVELAQESRQQRTVSLQEMRKESDLLSDELEIMRRDTLFEETLREVANLLT